jgi:hypothetical protein
MSKANKNTARSNVTIRVDDTIGFTNRRTYKVYSVDRPANTATLRSVTDNNLHTFPLDWLTDSCATFTNDCHVYTGHPAVWLPIPPGAVWYGFGYALPVTGGYAYKDSAADRFDGKKLVRDANGNAIPLVDHDPAKFALYMTDPARYWRFPDKKSGV